MTEAIRADRVSKVYARFALRRQFATLKSALVGGSLFRELKPEATFTAVEDVSFVVPTGTTVAIIGPNGSGKSTLLKLLAGVLKPTAGRVAVRGRTAALLELGTGFHPEVSGRENAIINGMMLGLTRRQIEQKLPEIARFAEIGDFIDAPVKTYSSGMYARLAFAVAFAVEPDVLLVDEILAVGDEAFGHKCLDRFHDIKRRGATIVFVTHGLALAEALADTVLLMEGGRLTAEGMPREVVDRYRGHVHARETLSLAQENVAQQSEETPAEPVVEPADSAGAAAEALDPFTPRRWGSAQVEIAEVVLRAKDGTPTELFQTGDTVLLDIEVVAHEAQADFVFGFAVRGRDGHLAYGTNTSVEGYVSRSLAGRARVRLELPALMLLEGSYALDVAVHRRDGFALDYRHACRIFAVRNPWPETGVARLEHAWSFEGLGPGDEVTLDKPPR